MVHPQERARPSFPAARRAARPRPAGALAARGPRAALAGAGFAAAFACLALLLFCWPFAADPPPPLALATGFVFCAWAAVVAVLWLVSRALAGEPSGRDEDA